MALANACPMYQNDLYNKIAQNCLIVSHHLEVLRRSKDGTKRIAVKGRSSFVATQFGRASVGV